MFLRRPPDAREYDEETLDRIQAEHLAYLGSLREAGTSSRAARCSSSPTSLLRGLRVLPRRIARRGAAPGRAGPAVQAGRLAVEVMAWWCPTGSMIRPGRPVDLAELSQPPGPRRCARRSASRRRRSCFVGRIPRSAPSGRASRRSAARCSLRRDGLGCLLVERRCDGRRPALLRQPEDDDDPPGVADRQLQAVVDMDVLRGLDALAVDVHAASEDGLGRRAPGLVEARRPQPLVDPHRVHALIRLRKAFVCMVEPRPAG